MRPGSPPKGAPKGDPCASPFQRRRHFIEGTRGNGWPKLLFLNLIRPFPLCSHFLPANPRTCLKNEAFFAADQEVHCAYSPAPEGTPRLVRRRNYFSMAHSRQNLAPRAGNLGGRQRRDWRLTLRRQKRGGLGSLSGFPMPPRFCFPI